MDASLTFLSQIRDNLEYADFDLIKQSIADLRNKFVPIAIIKKGWFIDRVRINRADEIFTRIEQVNYITDTDVLNKYVGFGRANFPKQAIFYGAIPSPQITYPRATAYLETTGIFEAKPLPDNVSENFTLSRWRVLEDIQVVEMIFSEDALRESQYVKTSFENQIKGIENHDLQQPIL